MTVKSCSVLHHAGELQQQSSFEQPYPMSFLFEDDDFTTSSRHEKIMQQPLLNMLFSRITVKGCLSVIIDVSMPILVSANTDVPY